MSVSQIISKLDKLFFINTVKANEEYQQLVDQLEKLDYSIMIKLIDRHSRM